MAKRRTTHTTTSSSTSSLVKACAFIGIFLSALLFVVGAILNWCKLGGVASILNLFAQIALLIAVAFPAWDFVKYKTKIWRVLYWVALVVYIFGCVFHVVSIYYL